MPKEYLISVNGIADMDRYLNEYLPAAGATVDEYDGKLLVNEFDPEPVEGEWDHAHTIVAEFPSADEAQEWWNDDTYQSDELEQMREEVFDYVNIIFAPEFEPEDLQ
ncbi:DUF1330 domain-containing protein [Natrarchaeobius chitinivorans]|uniref:DUF1330 domain-containing protein n=1 Tax=Natrarchaeobius chitinivorans TaxID=1679083 RepID=A0A3N6M044_NATCH|nr:DUF1330 domain-containing protein [Natrarchaeobius chitinivorans]RQG96583.1 DUF1330 domain-containing protein [Natrarchaeobius chitinivorans]